MSRYCLKNRVCGAESWDDAPNLQIRMTRAVLAAKGPILFFQAQNDYTIAPSRTLYAARKAARKTADIKIFPSFGDGPQGGHSFAYAGAELWKADVFRFLDGACGAAGSKSK